MQDGHILRKGQSWFLKYRETGLIDGKPIRKRVCKKLAPYCDDYRSIGAVRSLARELLDPLNAGRTQVESTRTVAEFVEHTFLPYAKERKRPSTYRGYLDVFRRSLKSRLTGVRLRDFRCANGEKLLETIAQNAPL